VELPPAVSLSAAFSLAARPLVDQYPVFEFLPPKPTLLQQLAAKYSSGRLQTVGLAAAAVVLLVGGIFAWQEFQLVRLHSQWAAIKGKVTDLQGEEKLILQYQPWFDNSYNELSILRALSLAFPEDGTVTAKSIEVREGNIVSCSGTMSSTRALLAAQGELSAADNVYQLKVQEIRGKSPMQFTFEFHWGNTEANNEN
jgi:hypothetical protein